MHSKNQLFLREFESYRRNRGAKIVGIAIGLDINKDTSKALLSRAQTSTKERKTIEKWKTTI